MVTLNVPNKAITLATHYFVPSLYSHILVLLGQCPPFSTSKPLESVTYPFHQFDHWPVHTTLGWNPPKVWCLAKGGSTSGHITHTQVLRKLVPGLIEPFTISQYHHDPDSFHLQETSPPHSFFFFTKEKNSSQLTPENFCYVSVGRTGEWG